MFFASCKVCDRLLCFADAELATALQCREHGLGSIPNRVGAVAIEYGPYVTEWVDANPGCTGAELAEYFGERSLEDERAMRTAPTTLHASRRDELDEAAATHGEITRKVVPLETRHRKH